MDKFEKGTRLQDNDLKNGKWLQNKVRSEPFARTILGHCSVKTFGEWQSSAEFDKKKKPGKMSSWKSSRDGADPRNFLLLSSFPCCRRWKIRKLTIRMMKIGKNASHVKKIAWKLFYKGVVKVAVDLWVEFQHFGGVYFADLTFYNVRAFHFTVNLFNDNWWWRFMFPEKHNHNTVQNVFLQFTEVTFTYFKKKVKVRIHFHWK